MYVSQSTLLRSQLNVVLQKSIGDLASGGGFAKLLSGDSGDSQQSQSKPQARKNR